MKRARWWILPKKLIIQAEEEDEEEKVATLFSFSERKIIIGLNCKETSYINSYLKKINKNMLLAKSILYDL